MKKQILSLLFFSSLFSAAQNPLVKMWDYRYGGYKDETLTVLKQTSDGGYILGGYSVSGIGGDKTQANWDTTESTDDYWIVKLDSLGNKQWDKTFGGTIQDQLNSIEQTSDGGYILGGYSYSGIGGDKTQANWGGVDYWIVKTDSLGNKMWDKDFGGIKSDELHSVKQTRDGGYILGGRSMSGVSGNKTTPNWDTDSIPSYDYWIVKLDSLGNMEWDKDFGGGEEDYFFSVQQTSDEGYILGGWSQSGIDGDKTEPLWGGNDYWILKTDSDGNKLWDKDFGGTSADYFSYLRETPDNGYILGGISGSGIGGDKSEPSWGLSDYWIIKTDSSGNKQWDKDLGGSNSEEELGNIFLPIDNPGYLIGGISKSDSSGNKSEDNLGYAQAWIIKTDTSGSKQWDKTILTSGYDLGGFIVQTFDHCYTIANSSNAGVGGYKTQPPWGIYRDFWIVKFCDSTFTTSTTLLEKEQNEISIFPNPTSGLMTINSQQFPIDQIEINNSLGEKYYSSAVNCAPDSHGECIVNCESFPPGIYFVKVFSDDKIFFKKIIKQ